MKIAFHDNSLSLRGTTVAIYDWAYWTRHYLNIEPIIMYDNTHPANNSDAIDKFKKEFPVFSYSNKSEIDSILSKNQCDYFLMEKGGSPDGVISTVSKNLVNAISGNWSSNWIHGDIYAMGSKWLSKITNYTVPYVPYMVYLPEVEEDMREELGIPKDSLVIGRNGGWETFDLDFVKSSIIQVLNEREDIWFVFQFTQPFLQHERVIYLPGSSDMNTKVRFINTCDAMLHARKIGESFGLSCAEFSIRNKPVITYYNSLEKNHIDTLGEKGIYYQNTEEILHILRNLDKKEINSLEWNCYQEYSPEKVSQKFKEIYLD
jgi:glycosyltransferase involved in cell wall biosynthesis